MRKIGSALAAFGLTIWAVAFVALPASATETTPVNEGVCAALDSGKIDVSGSVKTITVTAPEGYLVSGYCVKAGSINQGDGPEYVEVDPPVASVTFGHSTGKDISHYSVAYVTAPTPTPTPTTATPTPTTATPTPTTATPTPTTATPTPTVPNDEPTPTNTPTQVTVTPSELPQTGGPGAPTGLLATVAGILLASGAGLLALTRRSTGLHE